MSRLEALERAGIQIDGVEPSAGAMSFHTFFAYETVGRRLDGRRAGHYLRAGQALPVYWREAPPHSLQELPDPPPPAAVSQAKQVHMASLPLNPATLMCAELKRQGHVWLSLDPNSGQLNSEQWPGFKLLLHDVDVLLISARQAAQLFRPTGPGLTEMAEELGSCGPQIVVIKCGGQGQIVYLSSSGEHWQLPPYPARLVDVTGAGHAFCGGFSAGWLATQDPVEAALWGGVSASFAIEGTGPLYPLESAPGLAEARLASLRQAAF
jgi:sugar/nucleoside kinase (ribokinase family)